MADIVYDAGVQDAEGAPFQAPESQQQTRYRCGHAVKQAPLETADTARLDVEQRASEETVAPPQE